jgi:O-Antigen ligase
MRIQTIFAKFNTIHKSIAFGLFLLAAVMPIQNVLVVFGVNVLGLPNWIALWKEVLVIILLGLMSYDLFKNNSFTKIKDIWFLAIFDVLNVLVLVSSFVFNQVTFSQFVLGYRFELFWLWLWVIGFVWVSNLKITPVTLCQPLVRGNFAFIKKSLLKGIFLGFGLCLILTLGQLTIGQNFVEFFGYTKSETELAAGKINSPICHSIDFGVDSCRLSAPFSSPNHLAGYLLFMLAFCLYNAVKINEFDNLKKVFAELKNANFGLAQVVHSIIALATQLYFLPLSILVSGLLFLTYSRYSLIVLVIFWVFAILFFFRSNVQVVSSKLKSLVVLILLFTLSFSLLVTSFDPTWASKILPTFLAKPSSSIEHYRLTAVSLDILKSDPKILITGLGQGASGSSTKYFRADQNVIFNKYADLSYNWFIKPERISIPENWYLQLVLNGGLMYLLVYLFILLFPLCILFKSNNSKSELFQNLFVFLVFFGIIIGNIFLHLWENQTIAIYWTLIYLWYWLEGNTVS